jgi:manganese transport protein
MLNRLLIFIRNFNKHERKPVHGGLEILKYIGPGLLITMGFIDPGNWASNLAAGADYGFALLWTITLGTIMLIILQHNAAQLGIATGLCLAEAATIHMPKPLSRMVNGSGVFAAISTALAEILGEAIALNMLFNIPIKVGAVFAGALTLFMLFTNSYRALEKWIIGFVSLIGLSFVYELAIVHVDWKSAVFAWVVPSVPHGSMMILMSVLGAVVMPHNLFLHSEIIQSRQWNLEDGAFIKKQLRFAFFDTLLSMLIGWAINSAMIILAAATFFGGHAEVSQLQQAHALLQPLLGPAAALIFAVGLLCAGIASSITAGMAGGTIFAGFFGEPYDIKDRHSRLGVSLTIIPAVAAIFLIQNPFQGLLLSQMLLSIQLPITVITQIYLTSSRKVMGAFANSRLLNIGLGIVAAVLTVLNIMLFASFFRH